MCRETSSINRDLDYHLPPSYTFGYCRQNRDLILSCHHSGMRTDILDIITESMILSYGDMPSNSISSYRIYYYAGALYNMSICWLESGAKEAPSQMAHEFLRYSFMPD